MTRRTHRGRRYCCYLVIRRVEVLGYPEYLGPMVSLPRQCQRDAERLYGKPGHTLELVAWSKAAPRLQLLARANRSDKQ